MNPSSLTAFLASLPASSQAGHALASAYEKLGTAERSALIDALIKATEQTEIATAPCLALLLAVEEDPALCTQLRSGIEARQEELRAAGPPRAFLEHVGAGFRAQVYRPLHGFYYEAVSIEADARGVTHAEHQPLVAPNEIPEHRGEVELELAVDTIVRACWSGRSFGRDTPAHVLRLLD